MQHLPAGGLLLLLGNLLEELCIVTHELLDEAGHLVNRGIADLEQLHQAVDQLLLRSDASENVVVASEGLQECWLITMADAVNALVRALACSCELVEGSAARRDISAAAVASRRDLSSASAALVFAS